MDIDYQALLDTYLAESQEGVTVLEERLLALERRPDDGEPLAEAFRAVHTLKGDSGTLGFRLLAQCAHQLEDVLEGLRSGSVAVSPELISALLAAVDVLREMLANAAEGIEEMQPAHTALLTRLERLAAGEAVDEPEIQPPQEETAAEPAAEDLRVKSLRVGRDKLDELLNLTGEISIARSRLAQRLEEPGVGRKQLAELHREADRLYLDLQELVMQLRMVPIGPTFRHFVRLVRDLSRSLEKEALLVIEGGETEVDASVIELLRDPLTHMVRNALDHGIESPGERMARGKDPRGRITLSAYHAAGSLMIELTDDGAGLDREQILAQARGRGMVDEGDGGGEPRVERLILEPGLSTAPEVTDLSGRGVGMDVVRRNVEQLRGVLAIESWPGEGTKIRIRLPLTVAVIEGFRVGIGEESYVLPLDAVLESVELPRATVKAGSDDGSGVIELRGKLLPYLRLRGLFGVGGAPPRRENVVVVQHESGRVGLVVDTLGGQSQTVIKPLTKLFRGLPGIAGSAILGDGEVALILDVPGLLAGQTGREPKMKPS